MQVNRYFINKSNKENLVANEDSTFIITAKNSDDQNKEVDFFIFFILKKKKKGGDNFIAQLINTNNNKIIHANIKDNNDGTYDVIYNISERFLIF